MGGPPCTPASAVVRRGPQGAGRAVQRDGWIGRPGQWSLLERGPGTGGEPGTDEAALTGGRGAGTGGWPGTGVAEQAAGTGMWGCLRSAGLDLAAIASGRAQPLRTPVSPTSQTRTLSPTLSADQRVWAGGWTVSELCWP